MIDGPHILDQKLVLLKLVQMSMQTIEATLNLNMLFHGQVSMIWMDA